VCIGISRRASEELMGHFTVGNWGGRSIDGGDGGNCNGFLMALSMWPRWRCEM